MNFCLAALISLEGDNSESDHEDVFAIQKDLARGLSRDENKGVQYDP
jgi:hypothetical protein